LLAIAAVCIQAFVLFPKRTLIKERTQKLEGGVSRVVATLKGSLPEDTQKAVPFSASNLKIGAVEEFNRLDAELNRANAVAGAVLQGWDDTKVDLENTRQDLENTRAELENTRIQLEDARTQIVQLTDTIRSKDQELADKDRQIGNLEDDKSSLETQVADLNSRIATMQDQMAQLEEEKIMLESLLAKCEGERGEVKMTAGTSGKIVYVNSDWNFVVIDIGSNGGAQINAEMIAHRGDQMLGKIRISAVRENVSIAEVLPEFQTAEIKEGDDVLH
jgi:predicted RNase H-like nuclease (RuvC/YqgF family)